MRTFIILLVILDICAFAVGYSFTQQLTPSFLLVAAVNLVVCVINISRISA